ncbi:MAG: FecR family protein [Rhizobiaceae bacterium]
MATCLAMLPGLAIGSQKVGETVVVRNAVSANGSSAGTRRLDVSDAVSASEIVSASADSHGELRLNDDSLVIVGENSSVSLDDFVVAEGGTFKSGTLKVARGAFRFITGNSQKDTFRIKTPLADIGVRGTVFDVYVDESSGNTKVVLFNGALVVCTQSGECVLAQRSCDIIEVSSPNEIGFKPFLRSAGRSRSDEASQFGLSEKQGRFGRQWRASTGNCNARAAQEARDGRIESDNDGPDAPEPSQPSQPSQPSPRDDPKGGDDVCSNCQ